MKQVLQFTHRLNRDLTFDSICHACYQTIGNRRVEVELADDEKSHVCPGASSGLGYHQAHEDGSTISRDGSIQQSSAGRDAGIIQSRSKRASERLQKDCR
jgi:hypothetical protein